MRWPISWRFVVRLHPAGVALPRPRRRRCLLPVKATLTLGTDGRATVLCRSSAASRLDAVDDVINDR
jgi:hypothetical protein